jgi:plasmid stabilization system protein ParE
LIAGILADAYPLDGTSCRRLQICDYIEKHNNKNTARRVAILVCERIGRLSEFPEQGQEGRKAGDPRDDDRRPPISNQK